jgi:hypothetical protein
MPEYNPYEDNRPFQPVTEQNMPPEGQTVQIKTASVNAHYNYTIVEAEYREGNWHIELADNPGSFQVAPQTFIGWRVLPIQQN